MRYWKGSLAKLLLGLLLVGGCASLGPAYQKVGTVPDGKGVVYVYRPSSIIGGAVAYDVKVGETVVTTLHNGGYYPYVATPGEVEFWAKTESRSAVTLDVKAGEAYYIKGTVGVGFLMGRPHLMVVPATTAEPEIADCKLIPDPKPDEKK
jgi:hypothetical protein